MKKYIAMFLLLLVICFVSCNSKEHEKYTSLIADSANDKYGVDTEIDYWTGMYFKKNFMVNQSCYILGNTYSGAYSQSITNKMNSYTTDIYVDENNIEFGLRDDTGELVHINLMNAEFFNVQPYLPEVSNPDESSITLANEIASEFVDNISEYTQIVEEPVTRYKEKDGKTYKITYYVVTFAKKVNGYFSSDYIAVKVTSKGTLASIMMGDLNAFDNVAIDFDLSTVNQSISDKIESIYSSGKIKVRKLKFGDQKIVLTPNGEICMYSDIVIDGTDDANLETKTGLSTVTVLGKKQK